MAVKMGDEWLFLPDHDHNICTYHCNMPVLRRHFLLSEKTLY